MATNQQAKLAQFKQKLKRAAQGDGPSLQEVIPQISSLMQSEEGKLILSLMCQNDQEMNQYMQSVIKQAQALAKTLNSQQAIAAKYGTKLAYILKLTAPKFACGGKTKKKAYFGRKISLAQNGNDTDYWDKDGDYIVTKEAVRAREAALKRNTTEEGDYIQGPALLKKQTVTQKPKLLPKKKATINKKVTVLKKKK